MKTTYIAIVAALSVAPVFAYEYPLQFTTRAGNVRNLNVAGYSFNGKIVDGDCSYAIVTSGSGRGGHGTTTWYYNACTWDLYGNLLSQTPLSAEPVAPPPLANSGTEIVYAESGSDSAGKDTRGFGFVNTPSPQFAWETPSGNIDVIPWGVTTINVALESVGDSALKYEGTQVSSAVSGTITPSPGKATITGTTCPASVASGSSCSITVSYNTKTIACTPSPYGYAYTNIQLSLQSNSGTSSTWTETFTITGVPICDD